LEGYKEGYPLCWCSGIASVGFRHGVVEVMVSVQNWVHEFGVLWNKGVGFRGFNGFRLLSLDIVASRQLKYNYCTTIGRREYETFRPLRRPEIGDTIARGTIIDTED
jgi:hypothetical protein